MWLSHIVQASVEFQVKRADPLHRIVCSLFKPMVTLCESALNRIAVFQTHTKEPPWLSRLSRYHRATLPTTRNLVINKFDWVSGWGWLTDWEHIFEPLSPYTGHHKPEDNVSLSTGILTCSMRWRRTLLSWVSDLAISFVPFAACASFLWRSGQVHFTFFKPRLILSFNRLLNGECNTPSSPSALGVENDISTACCGKS